MIILSVLPSLDRVVITSYLFPTPSVLFSTPAPRSSITTSPVISTFCIYIVYPSSVCLILCRLVIVVVLIIWSVITTSILVISPVVRMVCIVIVVGVILIIISWVIIVVVVVIEPSIIIGVGWRMIGRGVVSLWPTWLIPVVIIPVVWCVLLSVQDIMFLPLILSQ